MSDKIMFKLQTPTVPNFIIIDRGEFTTRQEGYKEKTSICVADLSDEQLNAIADNWRKELFTRARRK